MNTDDNQLDHTLKSDDQDHLNKYYPLTPVQRPFWIAQQAHPSSSAYTVTRAFELQGKLDINRLEACINEAIKRHEILRTTFHQVDGQPMQHVEKPFTFKINFVDLRNEPSDSQKTKVKKIRREFEKIPWNLEKLPLFHVSAIQVKDDLFWLVLNFNHLIFDGFSAFLFLDEISDLYNSYPDFFDTKKDLLQYVDYTMWLNRQNSDKNKIDEALNFFKSYLQNNEPVEFYSVRKNFSDITSNESDLVLYELPTQLAKDITSFAVQHHISKFVLLLSAFFLLISRLNSGEEITIGLPVFNRSHPKLLKLFGLCLNTALISQVVDDEMTFLELIHLTEKNWEKAQLYDSFPYGEIVRELRPKHAINRNPYFDVLFNYMPNKYTRTWHLSGLEQICEDFNASETELFLSWYAIERGEDLILGCRSILELLDYKSMNILFWQFHFLLEQLIKNPEQKLSSYSLLFPKDIDAHHRALSTNASYTLDYSNYSFYAEQVKLPDPAEPIAEPNYPLVPFLIEDIAKIQATHPALVFGNDTWSYSNLISTAESIANELITSGIAKNDVVAIHGEMSFGLCASVIGTWLAGGVILLIDSTHPAQYKKLLLEQSKAKRLITLFPKDEKDKDMFGVFPDSAVIYVNPKAILKIAGEKPIFPPLSPHDPAYVFFTSGTTGIPKGVKGTHQGLSHFLNWQRTKFNITPSDRCGQITNLSFDVVMREVFTPLVSGATLYIPPPSHRIETGTYLDWVEENQITLQHIVPTLADFLLQKVSPNVTLKHLRWLFFAGEPLSKRLVNQWRNKFPKSGNIVNLYGPTETTLAKMFYIIPSKACDGIQPIGNPLPHTQIIILNKNKQQCGIGEAGEICIRTPYRTLGYINPSENDSIRFIPNPFSDDPNDLIYFSGDLGFTLDDGTICICGRIDDQIKINGIRIDPSGIGDRIAKDENVEQCVVIGKKSEEGKARLIAYIVPKAGLLPEQLKERILANLRGKLPNYMVPYAIVLLDKLPLTPRGKLDKRALPEPEITEQVTSSTKVRKPSTPLEKNIAAYWEKELGIASVNLDDDFFELGGDSLDGVKMIAYIHELYNVDIKLHDLITHSKLEQLTNYIESGPVGKMQIQMSVKELSNYVALPYNLIDEHVKKRLSNHPPQNIFITGAAGFLGSYLLNDLITVYPQAKFYCLIRAKNKDYGLKRIRDAFVQYKLKNIDKLKEHVIPIIGDLSEPSFGLAHDEFDRLCSDIDVIYHSGAMVNFVYTFDQLKSANVEGTKIVIELSATKKIKPIHYISTAGIYPSSLGYEQQNISDDQQIGDLSDNLVGGYVQTKWVADHLMQKARSLGIPVTIYRPGRISWDTKTAIWQEHDAIFRFIYGSIQLGYIPDLPISFDLNPVNMVSNAIIYVSTKSEYANKNFNIVNPKQIKIIDLANYLNQMDIQIDIVPYAEWRRKLSKAFKANKENALFPLMDLFAETLEDMPRLRYNRKFDNKNLLSALAKSNIQFPDVDYEFFHSFFCHFFKSIHKELTNKDLL